MFEMRVAWRFLREGKGQTLLIVVGICVGIAVQVFLSSLISGLQDNLVQQTVGNSSHVTVTPPEPQPRSLLADSVPVLSRIASSGRDVRPIRSWAPMVHQMERTGWFRVVSPVVEGAGFAFRGEKSKPILLRGVYYDKADSIYTVTERLVRGDATMGPGRVLIGTELAADLGVAPGSTIRLATSSGASDVFVVAGVFDLEVRQLNASWVLLPLARAQILLATAGGITAVETQVPRVFEAEQISQRLRASFPDVQWVSWQRSNAGLLNALRSQSSSSNLIQILVLAAVTLGISSVLAVSVMQKSRQIGILKAIGTGNAAIAHIFLIMGCLLGCVGALVGCGVGYLLIQAFLSATADAAGQPLFPLRIDAGSLAFSVAVATVAGTVAALAPARRSARLSPVEVIRNG